MSKVPVFVCDQCRKVKPRSERKVWLDFEVCLECAAGLKTASESEHPTYQDDPTPDEALPLASELVAQAKERQAAAIQQATDLAVKGWAAVTETPKGLGVWMVMEGTMRDWRGLLSTVKKQLSGIIRDQLSLGADHRVGVALEKVDVLLNELPTGEACEVCKGTRVYEFGECGTCQSKEARCSLK